MSTPALIGLSVLVFTGMVQLLVMILALAESKLVPKAGCRLLINDDDEKSPTVPAGQTLLSTLAAESIFVPSACGGQGTCGQCQARIPAGSISRQQTQLGYQRVCGGSRRPL